MKIFTLSDNWDTLVGMRLAGVKGMLVNEPNDAAKQLEDLLKDKEIGIILITETLAEKMREKVNLIKEKRTFPLIVEIPDRHGSRKEPDYITAYVRDSIGIKI